MNNIDGRIEEIAVAYNWKLSEEREQGKNRESWVSTPLGIIDLVRDNEIILVRPLEYWKIAIAKLNQMQLKLYKDKNKRLGLFYHYQKGLVDGELMSKDFREHLNRGEMVDSILGTNRIEKECHANGILVSIDCINRGEGFTNRPPLRNPRELIDLNPQHDLDVSKLPDVGFRWGFGDEGNND